MRFHSDPKLKPTEIQPPTTERRSPAVLARKPAPRTRLRRALRKGGAIAKEGSMLVLILLRNCELLIKSSLLDKRISIAFLITFCIGIAATFIWASSRQVISVPQPVPASVALSPPLEQHLEAMSSGLSAIRQSVDELANGLGQMRRDITNLQTTEQSLFDKISGPPQPPTEAPPARSTPRLPRH